MIRPSDCSRIIIIDVAVASRLVSNKERSTKLATAKAGAKRKVAESRHVRMPAGYGFKSVTFQASGDMSKDVQNILKQLPQRAIQEQSRMEAQYETTTYRLFGAVAIA